MNKRQTSETTLALINEWKSKQKKITPSEDTNAQFQVRLNERKLIGEDDNFVFIKTNITKHLKQLGYTRYGKPYLWKELIASLHSLPIRCWEKAQKAKDTDTLDNVYSWTSPGGINHKEILPLIGVSSARRRSEDIRKRAIKELTPAQVMLMIAYQASPRPISWSIEGLTVIDMIAWMYQDVIAMDLGINNNEKNFEKNINYYRDWLKRTPPRSGNCPLRHFRVRLGACLNVKSTIIPRVIKGQSEAQFKTLLQKLIENEGDETFTKGILRDHKKMLNDFNALSEYAIKCQYGEGSIESKRIEKIRCPSIYKKEEFINISLRVTHS